jgi:hypothetical protein
MGQIKNVAEVAPGKMLQSNDSGDDVLASYMRAANVQHVDELTYLDPDTVGPDQFAPFMPNGLNAHQRPTR